MTGSNLELVNPENVPDGEIAGDCRPTPEVARRGLPC